MNRQVFRTVIIMVLFICSTGWVQTLYVAPNGNDANSGTMDRPLATLEGARDAIRVLIKSQKGNISVLFRGGIYYFTQMVHFGPEDSGIEIRNSKNGILINNNLSFNEGNA